MRRLKKAFSVDDEARINYFLVADEMKGDDRKKGFFEKVKDWIGRTQKQKQKGGAA